VRVIPGLGRRRCAIGVDRGIVGTSPEDGADKQRKDEVGGRFLYLGVHGMHLLFAQSVFKSPLAIPSAQDSSIRIHGHKFLFYKYYFCPKTCKNL